MPKEGFISLTIREEVLTILRGRYNKHRKRLIEYGITNFNQFLVWKLIRKVEIDELNL